MSASIKFTAGSRSQEFRVSRLKWGLSLSRRSDISVREVWFSFCKDPLRTKQDDYSSRTTYYTLYTGNTYQSYRQASLVDDVYDWDAPENECSCGDAFCPTVRKQDAYNPPF
jgi:hypothetical protein